MVDYLTLLQQEIAPALGCTEPVAAAYAAAWAASALGQAPESLVVRASRNVLKNAMGVNIPGTDMVGLAIAAAMGALGGNPEKGLEVLSGCDANILERAKAFVAEGRARVEQKKTREAMYAEVEASAGGHTAIAILQRRHTLLTDLLLDGKALRHKDLDAPEQPLTAQPETTVRGIYDFCVNAPASDLAFLREGVDMNLEVALEGLRKPYGMAVGYNLFRSNRQDGLISNDISAAAIATTAAACDARMAGFSAPIMSVAGSGNQGIVCTLPVVVFADKLGSGEEKLLRAVALSDLITVHIKRGIGRLSALCGCGIAAAIGASCGITWLLGGEFTQICYAIQNMVANITGMVCDGAKAGCAIKVATAVSAAVQCAVLASNGVSVPCADGIIESDVENSIRNLSIVGREGMQMADQVILDMMCNKQ